MELYVIAGPSGVGKTTFARKFLPKYANCKNFVNADLIAEGMAAFSPAAAAVRTGRLVLSEIRFFSQRRASFALETTLSGRSNLRLIQKLKTNGYKVHVFLMQVASVEVGLSRIKQRVLKGGHDVPEAVVRRRFDRSFRNFVVEYRALAHSWYLFDNTSTKPATIAFKRGEKIRIIDQAASEGLTTRYGEK